MTKYIKNSTQKDWDDQLAPWRRAIAFRESGLYRRVRDGKWSAQCQGYARYAIPCRRRVTVDAEGYALCHHHQAQRTFISPLTSLIKENS